MKTARHNILIIIIAVNVLWLNIATAQTLNAVKIDLDVKSKTLKEVLQLIEQKSGLHFVYNDDLVAVYNSISVSGADRTVASILNEVLSKTNLWYLEQNNKIIIERRTIAPSENKTAIGKEYIIGKILEAGTDNPVRNATVYFDGTLNGTTSDEEGNFTLHPEANKIMPVIVSAFGYDTKTITDFPVGKKGLIYLNLKQNDLDAVTISASDGMSGKEKMRIFKREFLGTSSNAKNCEILNENDIRLSYNQKTNTIKAFSDKPIVIRNKNLGYTLKFFPKEIIFAPNQTMVQGCQFFEDDAALAATEKIQRARENTYRGSQIHFIRSLWNNSLKKNDFKVFNSGDELSYDGIGIAYKDRHKVDYDSIVVSRDGEKYMHLNGPLYIEYKGRNSFVGKGISDRDALIASNGYSDPSALIWRGIIGLQRIGDALPLDYKSPEVSLPVTSNEIKNVIASADNSGIHNVIAALDTIRSRIPAEKLYIQFDKPYYSTGDTIRLKAYLLDAAFLNASQKSGIAYVELANDTNKVLLRRILPLDYGLGMGEIVLNKDDIPEGSYTIRAYTNLMRNFGEDLIFRKSFYVSSSSSQSWLVNSKVSLSKQANKENMRMELQFNQLDKKNLGMHELDFRISDGKKVLMKDKVQTDIDGKLDVNFNLPEKTNPGTISLIVGDLTKGQEDHKVTIPLPVNRPENADIQFMPEGGNLVAGISSVVGFKAIGEDGHGMEVAGRIYSSSNSKEVAAFNSSHKGMGSFELSPEEGKTYTAKIMLNGMEKSFPLPEVKSAGTAMKVINNAGSDSIDVMLSSVGTAATGVYYLLAQSRGIICYGANIRISGNNKIVRKLDKGIFPTGITRFTLMNTDKQPLNERIAYISHHDNLNVTLSPAGASFGKRDSVSLDILVTNKEDQPVEGSFSLAVTDDNQVKTDSLSGNILTTVLVTSDLKGLVEDPGYYLRPEEPVWKDLDNLLLTQGWTGYDWKNVFNPPVPVYPAEPEFSVRGRVTNVFNKNSTATSVRLISMKPPALRDTLTDRNGAFTYSGLTLADTVAFFIQARNRNNKSFNVGVNVDEFKPPVFSAGNQRIMPWYVNTDTSLLKYVKTVVQKKEEQIKLSGGNILSEVTITAKKIIKDSKNLNGPGESDQTLDEKELQKAEKMTLLKLLYNRVSGFNEGEYPHPKAPRKINEPYRWSYRVNKSEIHLVIDGTDVEKLYTGAYYYEIPEKKRLHRERFEYIKDYLESFLAEDVKGIEVMYNPKYNSRYNRIEGYPGDPVLNDFAYIEITTKSGKGPYQGKMPGTFNYRPMPFILPKEFYRPRYIAASNNFSGTDFRSTIHWAPDIVTDKDGKAQVSFYSVDTPGTYSIIIEGSDMNGNIGRQTGRIIIR